MPDTPPTVIRSKKTENAPADENEWLITYADAITLLMTFFVLMLSVSTIDQSKFEEVSEALNKGMLQKDNIGSPFQRIEEEVKKIVEEEDISESVSVMHDPKGIKIEFSSTTFYDVGKASIKPGVRTILKDITGVIRDVDYDNFIVEVEGHTDDVPIRNAEFPSNWELSATRATNVVRFFINEGIDKSKLMASGYADSRPKDDSPNLANDGSPILQNRAKNRRIVVYIHRKW
jgi:chemotaxis protein MotB